MATYDDERRTTRDRITDTSGAKTVGFLVALAVIGFILYMLFAASNPRTTGDAVRQTPQSPQTTVNPRTTAPPSNTTTTPAPTAPTAQPK
jgi:hypothetical protein